MKNKKLIRLVITALFMALTAVATAVIRIPSLLQGYVNAGDVIVLLCGWTLGPLYGMIAAGIGSAIVDLATGYAHYAPGTLLVKAATALIAYLVFRALEKSEQSAASKVIARVISGIAAETVMILGYFGYSSLLLGNGLAAASSIPGNILQAITGIVLGTAMAELLYSNRQIKKFLDHIR